MANKDPSRTEKPTPKRINKERNNGNVLTSPDISSFVLITGGCLLLFVTIPIFYDGFRDIMRRVLNVDCRVSWNAESVAYTIRLGCKIVGWMILPFCLGVSLLSILVMRYQVGKFFSMKPLKWKFSKFNPASGIKQLLPNKNNLVKLLLTLCKVSVIAVLVYWTIRGFHEELLGLPVLPVSLSTAWVLKKAFLMVMKIMVIFVVIMVLDYIHKRKSYYDNLMMTKQEVKDERKQSEGDPQIKAKIRSKMREILQMQMMSQLPKADVVVTNPTHVAVALKYKIGSYAPIVIAKGLRKRAERIKLIARHHDVPIVEAPPLARTLYRSTKIGHFIPPELFGAVAAILAKLHRTGRRRFNLSTERMATHG